MLMTFVKKPEFKMTLCRNSDSGFDARAHRRNVCKVVSLALTPELHHEMLSVYKVVALPALNWLQYANVFLNFIFERGVV